MTDSFLTYDRHQTAVDFTDLKHNTVMKNVTSFFVLVLCLNSLNNIADSNNSKTFGSNFQENTEHFLYTHRSVNYI